MRNIKDWKRLCLGNNLIWWSWWKINLGYWNLQDRRTTTTDLSGAQDLFSNHETLKTRSFIYWINEQMNWFETSKSNNNGVEWICNHEKLVENTLCLAQEMFARNWIFIRVFLRLFLVLLVFDISYELFIHFRTEKSTWLLPSKRHEIRFIFDQVFKSCPHLNFHTVFVYKIDWIQSFL